MSTRAAADESARPDALRDSLLEAAARLFLTRGYAEVSMRHLAAACGVTTGAIYNRFRGKLDLLVAAIEAGMDTELEAGRRRLSARELNLSATEPGVHEEDLARIAEAYPGRAGLRALLLEGAAAARRDSKLRTKLREEQMQHLRWWTEIYRAWQRGQHLDRTVDIEAVMMLLWSAELGLGVLEACGIELPSPRAWRMVVERLVGSLRVKESPPLAVRARRARAKRPQSREGAR